jgi:hypothetical protein
VLRIHASSEDDPFFLHTLEVTEDEFQCLKADQGILVDFASFPGVCWCASAASAQLQPAPGRQ